MSKRSLWVSLILTVLASFGAVTIAHVTDTTPTLVPPSRPRPSRPRPSRPR